MRERFERTDVHPQIVRIKERADYVNYFCLLTSIYQIANSVAGVEPPYWMEMVKEHRRLTGDAVGVTYTDKIFKVLDKYSSKFGIEISKVMVNENYSDFFEFPKDLPLEINLPHPFDREINGPVMLVLIDRYEDQAHVDVLDNTQFTEDRIERLLMNGWKNILSIEFKKTTLLSNQK